MQNASSPAAPLLVGVSNACSLLGVGRSYLYQLIAAGRLRPIKVGKRTLFQYADLVRFVEHAAKGGRVAGPRSC